MIMGFHIDTWNPAYGTGMDPDEGPSATSTAAVDATIERPLHKWLPIPPDPSAPMPSVLHFVDGVRRIDAHFWMDGEDHDHIGVAASYAAGSVECDLSAKAATLRTHRVERGLFSAAPDLVGLGCGPTAYRPWPAKRGDLKSLVGLVQGRVGALEAEISNTVNRHEDLLVVDGPLRSRASLPNVLGYVKTHQSRYLPTDLSKVIGTLKHGERSPIFLLGTEFEVFSWYLRLPGPGTASWSGIVRVECASDLTTDEAINLANVSAIALPRFASCAYKDPRAPQNLIPIAGLERRLRSLLGDARLLHRTLVKASTAS
jgi:uncharacterized protein